MSSLRSPSIAVLIPCFNEALTITQVVSDFRRILPTAAIHVYDNNSTDDSAALARAAGAIVTPERRQGKGYVVQAMFRDITADLYIMVDGDATYPAERAHDLLAPLISGSADMVVGNRLVDFEATSYRPLHVMGNRLVVGSINFIFKAKMHDVMSGYRAFSRRFVESVPAISRGFEVETELTLQTLHRHLRIVEIPIHYGTRPEGSLSKLSTFRAGPRVLFKIIDIFKAYRPLMFFGLIGLVLGFAGLLLGSIPVREYMTTGRIDRFPTAILAAALEIMALVAVTCGVILDSVNHHFREASQLVLQTLRKSDPS